MRRLWVSQQLFSSLFYCDLSSQIKQYCSLWCEHPKLVILNKNRGNQQDVFDFSQYLSALVSFFNTLSKSLSYFALVSKIYFVILSHSCVSPIFYPTPHRHSSQALSRFHPGDLALLYLCSELSCCLSSALPSPQNQESTNITLSFQTPVFRHLHSLRQTLLIHT